MAGSQATERYIINNINEQFPKKDPRLEWLVHNCWPNGLKRSEMPACYEALQGDGTSVYGCDWYGYHISPIAGTIRSMLARRSAVIGFDRKGFLKPHLEGQLREVRENRSTYIPQLPLQGRLIFDAGELHSELRPLVGEDGQVAGYVFTDPR
jgi:hypothetical protein